MESKEDEYKESIKTIILLCLCSSGGCCRLWWCWRGNRLYGHNQFKHTRTYIHTYTCIHTHAHLETRIRRDEEEGQGQANDYMKNVVVMTRGKHAKGWPWFCRSWCGLVSLQQVEFEVLTVSKSHTQPNTHNQTHTHTMKRTNKRKNKERKRKNKEEESKLQIHKTNKNIQTKNFNTRGWLTGSSLGEADTTCCEEPNTQSHEHEKHMNIWAW